MSEFSPNTRKQAVASQFILDQDERIRNNLRRIRLDKPMRVVDMARQLNISTNQYSNLELGKSKLNLHQLFAIIQILECPYASVFDFVEEYSQSLKDEIEQLKLEIIQLKDHNRLLMKEVQSQAHS